ncbi:MAG: hypothetical protein EXS25_11700 [Pedosphaera sp.]|nr:hypothetical protein [Pedosphaera sp.]
MLRLSLTESSSFYFPRCLIGRLSFEKELILLSPVNNSLLTQKGSVKTISRLRFRINPVDSTSITPHFQSDLTLIMQHNVFRFGLIGWLYLCLVGQMLGEFPLVPTKFQDDATLWREFADALGKKYQEGKTPKLRDLYTQLERTNRASIRLKNSHPRKRKPKTFLKSAPSPLLL